MNCSEIIDIFEKTGGILTCDYAKMTMSIENTRLKCKINSNDFEKIENCYVGYGYTCLDKVTELEYDKKNKDYDEKVNNSTIKFVNYRLQNNQYGFVINIP